MNQPGRNHKPLPDILVAAEGPPPVFIGSGSMLSPQADRTLSIVLDAVRKTGNRAVLYTHLTGRKRCFIHGKNIITVGYNGSLMFFP